MKRNAIIRIVIYSITALLLLAVMIVGIGVGNGGIVLSGGNYTKGPGAVSAQQVQKLEIDWAAGSVTLTVADTDTINFTDGGSEECPMGYSLKNGVLKLSYNGGVIVLGSSPEKDLTVTVPESWVCQELDLDGAALQVNIQGVTVQSLEIDGASNQVNYSGSLGSLDCDGASNKITVSCTNVPEEIELDGASVSLELTMPEDSGFRVEMEGLSCTFRSDYDHDSRDGVYSYGDGACEISADGVSCSVYIKKP